MGDSGGGFNKYASTPKGSQTDTPSRASRNATTLRPVTIKQVLESTQPHPDTDFRIDDTDLGHISFIGQVTNVTEQATTATLALNDGTGLLEVRTFFADPEYGPKVPLGEWARIIGSLKSFGGKRHVNALQIQSIYDLDEINHHLLEATAVHLHFTRGPAEQFAQAAVGTEAPGGGYDDPMTGVQPQPVMYQAPGTGFGGDAAYGAEATMYDEEGVVYDAGGGVALEASRQGTGLGGEPGVYQGEPGVYQGEPGVYQGEPGVYQGEPGVYQGEPGVYQGEPGVYQGEGEVYQDAGTVYEDNYGSGMYTDDTGYSGLAKRILDGLRSGGAAFGTEGVHLHSISQMSGLSIPDTEKGLNELLVAGVIYTTVDDSHFTLM